MTNKWIRSKKWDLTWLVFSVLTVPLAPLMYYMGLTAGEVATVIMIAVGGPHVFVTFTRTNMDPRFRQRHRTFTNLVFVIPVLTALFAWLHTSLFLTFFFTWASLHVLQQITYVTNCYSRRQDVTPTPTERWVEYGLIFSCLYPFATVRMVEGTFMLDGTKLLVPEALLGPGLIWLSFAVFGAFLVAWLVYVVRRARANTLHYGKTGLLTATVLATFFTPLFPNLDVAFQGINTWHCIQYLALIWYVNRLRRDRGATEMPFVKAISEQGWRGFLRYYGAAVGLTTCFVFVVFGAKSALGISELMAFYIFGKGVLLAHYYFDTFLFTQDDELSAPAPMAVAA